MEDLLTSLSTSFINVNAEELDDLIINVLRRIVMLLGVDRSTIAQFDKTNGLMRFSHSWAVPGIKPLPPAIDEENYPYLARTIRAGQNLILESLENLPDNALVDRRFAHEVGLKSVAIVPLMAGGTGLGFLSIGALTKPRRWPEKLVNKLTLIGEVFANALLRARSEFRLKNDLARNRTMRKKMQAETAIWREQALNQTGMSELVGDSPAITRLLKQVEQVARTDSTVLLLGETGTGKDLIAQMIHEHSRRSARPLVRVNCAALPESLIESELFGHEKGAFTGAVSRRSGRFEAASEGTIILDEIGELPIELQPKLLHILQTGEFNRLGSTTTHKSNARVIASTNRNIDAMVASGSFREDLYYRLGVFPIILPPLRQRKSDIPLLVAYFIEKLGPKLGKPSMTISPEQIEILANYHWPGNIRELENIIERSMILSSDNRLRIELLTTPSRTSAYPQTSSSIAESIADYEPRTLEQVQRDYIEAICVRCNWKIAGPDSASEILDINPSTLRSRISKLGINRP
ncbi:MAG: hypothetical protein DHS20C01_08810 [marine bacterium B5-7]|nr:MAG: hypothetical protein DHS20C01_08810 [marine bacterium B5-7]